MKTLEDRLPHARYKAVSATKATGETYTPKALSDFVASNIVERLDSVSAERPLRILDPAIGDGELLVSLLEKVFHKFPRAGVEAHGFEPNQKALGIAEQRLRRRFPEAAIRFNPENFLQFVLKHCRIENGLPFGQDIQKLYDLIIANPPYVRTQVLDPHRRQLLTKQFQLSGRIDLYYAFILAIAQALKPGGIAGIIASNRFMTTRSGSSVRRALLEKYSLRRIWDLGDTKLFTAAVLPAVLIAEGKNGQSPDWPNFTSIYETDEPWKAKAPTPVEALSLRGVVQVKDGRKFLVKQGKLDFGESLEGVWRVATRATDRWLATVASHTWGTFGNIGKIRVGVKTCADKVFIRSDWQRFPEMERPELLRPLTTHHIARRFKALTIDHPWQILYPHEVSQGVRRAVDLFSYPRSKAYLERHRAILESRRYVTQAGRKWYEIWVPQDPTAWRQPKLVFRDIAEQPTFWIDLDGSVVNGDCYWLTCHHPKDVDLLWLAVAVVNSRFIETFYDIRFHNKLYAKRRRYITQYVEQFPLPNPGSISGKAIIAKAKEAYMQTPPARSSALEAELEEMVWTSFGLAAEKIASKPG